MSPDFGDMGDHHTPQRWFPRPETAACEMIPIVNLLAILPHLILWIIYWVKIAGFSQQLDDAAMRMSVPTNPV